MSLEETVKCSLITVFVTWKILNFSSVVSLSPTFEAAFSWRQIMSFAVQYVSPPHRRKMSYEGRTNSTEFVHVFLRTRWWLL